ncbi:gustatory receptor for sugar taste 64f-like isoform X1 [Danaus plexippus]|uniref:gustatory receptor for sugar taste 64f-like isoform X1 n=1 Tax=Danaus plexippus TaxID=13037 RepID=UPI002AB0074A|nr:gustatory receptor for sugar taste 64f-like isoform X1 [Danaus plexippus]XP_061382668.1 gustatory receptor for sugar taste 64f-like isoform X1 [Danaus plexippus]
MDYATTYNRPVKKIIKSGVFSAKEQKSFNSYGRSSERRPTFQGVMKLTIILGQFVGLNPVLGVCDVDSSKLRFTYLSGRCAYTLLTIVLQTLLLNILFLLKYFKDTNTSIVGNTPLVFYSSTTMITILFLHIAMKWPNLCRYISCTEAIDPLNDYALVRKCNVACLLVLSFAFVEHGLLELSGFVFATDCSPPGKVYETIIVNSFPWFNNIVNYNLNLGIITQLLNIQCTFNWNFSNLFVINISLYLTSRLEQINNRISAIKGKAMPSTFWRNVREDYNRITSLVRKVDKVIGGVIFISFANNLFFICFQLLHTLAGEVKATPSCHTPDQRIFRGYEQATYFLYSLIFLIVRSLALSLIAARVHTVSRQPVYTLYELPSADYGMEVQRFIDQIHGDTVALTGLQFFKVTRGIALAIAGTIVTYELVLMQFTGVNPTVDIYTDDSTKV